MVSNSGIVEALGTDDDPRDIAAADVKARLKDYVRSFVRKEGEHYQHGAGRRLAESIGVDPGWVSRYVDYNPKKPANPSYDQLLAICAHFKVRLEQFRGAEPPKPRLTAAQRAARRVGERWSRLGDDGQQAVLRMLDLLEKAGGAGGQATTTDQPETQAGGPKTSVV